VEETLAGRGEAITQATLATQVFDRKVDFDAIVDPIVRIQAGRLRRSLERYYLLAGKQDSVRIAMPKGTYIPMFRCAAPAQAASARTVEVPSAATENAPLAVSAGDSWPVVVVSGFDATGADSEAEAEALEVRDELALELGRYRAVRVQRQSDLRGREPNGGARFALNGRLRRDPEGLRITAHLVDRSSGLQVWGEEYRTNPGPERWSGSPDEGLRGSTYELFLGAD
jgi:TolB-like protein